MNPRFKLTKSLKLDKEVISKLQEKQMENITGGIKPHDVEPFSHDCSCIHHSCYPETNRFATAR